MYSACVLCTLAGETTPSPPGMHILYDFLTSHIKTSPKAPTLSQKAPVRVFLLHYWHKNNVDEEEQVTHSPPDKRRNHERVHARLKVHIEDLIREARERLGIETVWSIETCVCCPEDLPNAEASIWWHAELFYARLYIRCSHQHTKNRRLQALPPAIINWLVYH